MLIFIYFDSPRSQEFVETEKISMMGHTISSKADIICSRLDTRSGNPIICVCKVCASFYNLDIPISVTPEDVRFSTSFEVACSCTQFKHSEFIE